ncbi:MAG: hypothetical protein ACE5LS_05320 [Thermoplasmata archaeon]
MKRGRRRIHPPSAWVMNILFWGLFVAIAIGSYFFAQDQSLGLQYTQEFSLATYTTVVQGVGVLLAIVVTGVLLLMLNTSSAATSLEDRTLGVLNNRLGWSVIKWSDELEFRIDEEFVGQAYTADFAEDEAAGDHLEKELDDLLDAILVEEDTGGPQVQQQVTQQKTRAALSSDVREVISAVRERRTLMQRKTGLMRTMMGPLAMLGTLVALAAWAIPAIDGFLISQAALNTSLVLTSTYGGMVALLFLAAAGVMAVAR